ncbi:hypothetical protein F5Y16DRAFT_403744 [Xylariaceae sp. FL0255]|nr:hypothetical protein F5Y16DRAFT_403744 [Xylariaceae sp. FL0255]
MYHLTAMWIWAVNKVADILTWLGIDPPIMYRIFEIIGRIGDVIAVGVYNRGRPWPEKLALWVNYGTIVFIIYNIVKRFVGEWGYEE